MKKRLIAALMTGAMAFGLLAGCGQAKPANQKPGEKTNAPAAKIEVNPQDVPTIKIVTVGGGMPANYAAWQKQVDALTVPKSGCKVDVEVVPWGNWDQQRNVLMTSGTGFDIVFGNLNTYPTDIRKHAIMDISPLLDKYAPELKKSINANLWKAMTVDGKIYGVPTPKDSAVTMYCAWDKAAQEKYAKDLDLTKMYKLSDLTPFLEAITKGEGKPAYPLNKDGVTPIFSFYDNIGTGLPFIGVRYNNKSGKVVNVFDQPEIMQDLQTVHEWYQKGLIPKDAATYKGCDIPADVFFNIVQGWPLAAKTSWGIDHPEGVVVSPFTPTILSNGSVQGSINSIATNCKHPEQAIKLLQQINTDPALRDLFFYGEKDKNFEYVQEDGQQRVKKLNTDWKMAGYTQGSYFIVTPEAGQKVNQWDQVKEMNEKAEASVLLGFTPDLSSVQDQMANLNTVYNKYHATLLAGTDDPAKLIPQMDKELQAAGLDKVIKVCQEQVDKFLKNRQ